MIGWYIMMFPPMTFLFGDYAIATAESGRSRFGHTFGGPHDRQGTSRDGCGGILIHLLHRLNLEDPAIPISIPGIQWLPFYYCFDFRANELGYRLTSDESLVIFFPKDDRNVTDHEEWPGDDYPMEFPKSRIKISSFEYNPADPEDAWTWSGVFGIEKLSEADRAKMKTRVANERFDVEADAPMSEEEFQELLSNPFAQAKPNGSCLNPDCPNHNEEGQLQTIALMPAEPVRGVHTFGEFGAYVQLIFQICNECHAIRVSNQCT